VPQEAHLRCRLQEPHGRFEDAFAQRRLTKRSREYLFRDRPKRGPREASKADLDVMRRPKWVQKSLHGVCRATPRAPAKAFRTVSPRTWVNKGGRKGQSALGVDLSLSSPSAAGGLGPIY
jgi:hypothetical protein